nr:DNA methyltransferase [Bacillus atrophaeus]
MKTNLQKKIDSYGEGYWDFKNIKRGGIHKLASYPAMMVAPMQHRLIEDIYNMEKNISNIFDPFHGSGTTLVEGKKLNLNLIGIDINPLANIITKVKIQGVDKDTVYESIEKLICNIEKISKENNQIFTFDKIDKWFREDIIKDLSTIRKSIIMEKNEKNRLYFWVCLSDMVRKYSNTRSSTFKLHIKEKEKISNMNNNLFDDFIRVVKENQQYLNSNKNIKYNIVHGDSLLEMEKMESESIDLICTSPPYGDNNTTVTYGQFSILSLLWIDSKDYELTDDALISNFSAIDTYSMGGKKKLQSTISLSSLSKVLSLITPQKQVKVKNFFQDYTMALKEMIRLLKSNHLMVLTLGNRRVDNIEIKLDEITQEFCLKNNMTLEAKLNRGIPRKRMPKKISRIENHGAVNSMNKETVLIFRKKGE